ncbi:MAG TPA: sugar ABC transporter permease [Anaerolineaceae bacterium]|nr:sugar ABC transporter permease [Anaerolineaceae bacterium]
MSTSTVIEPELEAAETVKQRSKKRFRLTDRLQSFLLLLPSFVAIVIFVYGFISFTIYVSFTNWRSLRTDMSLAQPITANYEELFGMPRFQADMRNTLIFTVLFMALSLVLGLGLAILLDRNLVGGSFLRNVYLFPYALSFVVSGVAWRWLFNPEAGVNVLFGLLGINSLLAKFGVGPLHPGWATDPTVILPLNHALAVIFPGAAKIQVQLGIPVAIIPVAIAASWQLSGFVMAMYVGGMATISEEVREAARIDGASEWQMYRKVIIPMLAPVTISLVVLLLHTSLKIFDLVYTMTGSGPGFATDVPAIFVFETMFKATRYNLAAAGAVFMLIVVGCVVIPYLSNSLKRG